MAVLTIVHRRQRSAIESCFEKYNLSTRHGSEAMSLSALSTFVVSTAEVTAYLGILGNEKAFRRRNNLMKVWSSGGSGTLLYHA